MSDQQFDIVAVLEKYGWDLPPLRGAGWQKVRCHEHDDQHASASVNLDLGAVRCFGCDFSGDAISIIRTKEGCSYREAVRIAEEITGGECGLVRGADPYRGGLPSQSRNQPRRRPYIPAWRRVGPVER